MSSRLQPPFAVQKWIVSEGSDAKLQRMPGALITGFARWNMSVGRDTQHALLVALSIRRKKMTVPDGRPLACGGAQPDSGVQG
uniref:LSDAT_euk domain-containing protein n=1 Tax=Steinernema glaseri TaxID=37863 RepID=A0A1I7YEB2_9BILA